MGKEHIICIDDEFIVLQSLKQELKNDEFFRNVAIETVDSGEQALSIIEDILNEGGDIPVIISDQSMPQMNGDEFLSKAHKRIPDTLKILLTGYSELTAVIHLVNEHALYRYLSKPWDRHDLLLTIREACQSYRQKRLIAAQVVKIENLTLAMVTTLESTNFYFDEDTGNHIIRISRISEFIAQNAGLDDQFVKMVKMYAPLHDIGKIGVGKEVLLKPGALTPGEFEQVKEHVRIGHRILANNDIEIMAKNIVLYHHEKWAGRGYVNGLSGVAIPLEARIVSIADVFDALVHKRVYKPAYPCAEALEIIRKERGISFEPELVDVFLAALVSVQDPVAFFGNEKT